MIQKIGSYNIIKKIASGGMATIYLASHKDTKVKAAIKLLKEVKIVDYVIVHTGFALEVVDSAEAEKKKEIFKEIANTIKDEFP